ncbi:tRNA pseudouridine55 synthase [Sinobacterium caligoides]|uniref:tRNA pseudouridine synthase B n=1 Tax=Sinobacterium caligoides TaxID=933926 RepID=A0A3N2DFR3_9GAMM|nr:tRNA pseudouridine(55) synthase TruB [Sinobacterium caligoides]ROR98640.1 tRNA pseudouridine55 synthase [Sinobacterium caligoides]
MARRKRGRLVDGIIVLDKPAGMTSNGALQRVKRAFFAQKAGHTGALDPLATGVLPLCFGEATKYSQYLLDSDKAYRSVFTLGVTTDSSDADGEVTSTSDASLVTREQVEQALEAFRGDIQQLPSMFSALKHNGQPLYKLARQGKEVERKLRDVTIFRLDLIDYRPGPKAEVEIEVYCSKGTYIRSIAEDLGHALGCGAHVSVLRRITAGPFGLGEMVSLEYLESLAEKQDHEALNGLLLPVDTAVEHLPEVYLDDDTSFYIRQGQPVMAPGLPLEGLVRIKLESGQFIGLGEVLDDGRLGPRRLIAEPQEGS